MQTYKCRDNAAIESNQPQSLKENVLKRVRDKPICLALKFGKYERKDDPAGSKKYDYALEKGQGEEVDGFASKV